MLRGGDVYLEINYTWMECQVKGLRENAQGESVGEGVISRGDRALGIPVFSQKEEGKNSKEMAQE